MALRSEGVSCERDAQLCYSAQVARVELLYFDGFAALMMERCVISLSFTARELWTVASVFRVPLTALKKEILPGKGRPSS